MESMENLTQEEIEAVLNHPTFDPSVLDQEGFEGNESSVCKFILLSLKEEDSRLRFYASRSDLGKWQGLALWLLGETHKRGDYLSSKEVKDLEYVLADVILDNVCEDTSLSPFVYYILPLLNHLERLNPSHEYVQLLEGRYTMNAAIERVLRTNLVRLALNDRVFNLYVRAIKARVLPFVILPWEDFYEVGRLRLSHGKGPEGLEFLCERVSLEVENIRLLIELGLSAKDGVKGIKTVEDALKEWPKLSSEDKEVVREQLANSPLGVVDLGELPIKVHRLDLELLRAGLSRE